MGVVLGKDADAEDGDGGDAGSTESDVDFGALLVGVE